jgi:ATP-binding cassette subfamily B protein
MFKFPFYQQPDAMDCGATCLRMIAKHYGKSYTLPELRTASFTTREGASLMGLSEAAENIGFHTLAVKVDFYKVEKEAPLPCIAHWNQNHFVVVYKIKKNKVYVADPAHGLITYTKQEFLKSWVSDANETVGAKTEEGVLLLLEPTVEFYNKEDSKETDRSSFKYLYNYLFKYKKLVL